MATRPVIGLLLVATACGGAAAGAPDGPAVAPPRTSGSYVERRAQHATRLTREAPLSEGPRELAPSFPVERITYRSGALELVAWLALPEGAGPERPAPAIVYLHGEAALDRGQLDRLAPFLEAGLAVFAPTLRGRNGNPGSHELVYGEVDDAAAAVLWLSAQPSIDRTRIFTVGHSMGGAVSVMLSLLPDLPVRETASIGGIYSTDTLRRWARAPGTRGLVPFDAGDTDELELRVPGPHAAHLAHPHFAYMGAEERTTLANARAVQRTAGAERFHVEVVVGDHFSAVAPALESLLARLRGH